MSEYNRIVESTSADRLLREPGFEINRTGRYLVASLLAPHRVLSTCTVNGGLRDDLHFLLNHQSCEGKDHLERQKQLHDIGLEGYHLQVCGETGIPPSEVAMMGTAANMNYASVVSVRDQDLKVVAVVTAGVQGNATCAGDPAAWRETSNGWEKVLPPPEHEASALPVAGTINTMLLINHPLTEAALVRTTVTMTEAKSAALTRLSVGSRYSADCATGTGTDQFCIAAQNTGGTPLGSASTHVKLGELIGVAVRDATLEALRWQNGLEASYTRAVFHALGRFGVTEDALLAALRERLDERPMALFRDNAKSVFYEPMLSAAAYAIASVLDRLRYQTIPQGLAAESLRSQGASMACALAAMHHRWPQFYLDLCTVDASCPLHLVADAIALGWKAKWI